MKIVTSGFIATLTILRKNNILLNRKKEANMAAVVPPATQQQQQPPTYRPAPEAHQQQQQQQQMKGYGFGGALVEFGWFALTSGIMVLVGLIIFQLVVRYLQSPVDDHLSPS